MAEVVTLVTASPETKRSTAWHRPSSKKFQIPMRRFSAGAQLKFKTVLGMAGLASIARVWAGRDALERPVGRLFELPDGSGTGQPSDLPRAVIVAGIQQKELLGRMNVCKKTGVQQAFWATLTPTSQHWTLKGAAGGIVLIF